MKSLEESYSREQMKGSTHLFPRSFFVLPDDNLSVYASE